MVRYLKYVEEVFVIRVNGKDFKTITDVAPKEFGVTAKTFRDWIEAGIVSKPPKINYGILKRFYCPEEYVRKAKAEIERYRDQIAQERERSKKT